MTRQTSIEDCPYVVRSRSSYFSSCSLEECASYAEAIVRAIEARSTSRRARDASDDARERDARRRTIDIGCDAVRQLATKNIALDVVRASGAGEAMAMASDGALGADVARSAKRAMATWIARVVARSKGHEGERGGIS